LKYFAMPLLVLLAMAALLMNCKERLGDPIFRIRGTVIDSTTGLPMDSAWIDTYDSIPPYYIYSDSSGYYITQFGGIHWINIYCGKTGYLISHKRLYGNRDFDNIDFRLILEQVRKRSQFGGGE